MDRLPFDLTDGQKRAWEDIRQDLTSGVVMNRLIQGDVGSGKTIVAVLALLACVGNGHQGAIMVPTEVLAEQHLKTFQEYLEPFDIRVDLLVGSMTASQKRRVYEALEMGMTDIVIGTHALIQEKVHYKDLALVVTDEQHRFGVRQREEFSQKGLEPHMLVMSATPIPRTLAIILYGDLDISVIDVMPSDRLPIKTVWWEPPTVPRHMSLLRRRCGRDTRCILSVRWSRKAKIWRQKMSLIIRIP